MDYLFRGGSRANDELLADAEAYGITLPEEVKQPEHYVLWPEHWPAVNLFQRCITQWRATSGGVIGLDYGVVLQIASLYGIRDPALALEDLQVMELHARDRINEKQQRRKG